MAKKFPKSSGLDIEGLMTDIDNSESIQKRSDDLAELLRRTNQAIENQVKLLGLANDKVENLTIRKLTYKNPTMKEKFDEALAELYRVCPGAASIYRLEPVDGRNAAFTLYADRDGVVQYIKLALE